MKLIIFSGKVRELREWLELVVLFGDTFASDDNHDYPNSL